MGWIGESAEKMKRELAWMKGREETRERLVEAAEAWVKEMDKPATTMAFLLLRERELEIAVRKYLEVRDGVS